MAQPGLDGYEQWQLMRLLNVTKMRMEMVEACQKVDCSWDEAFRLAEAGFVGIEATRSDRATEIWITVRGQMALEERLKAREQD